MAKGEAEFLKQRAERFLETGKELLNKKYYDLAAFNLEQYCQLILKYYLFIKIGDFPKTHFLKELLKELSKAYGKKKDLEEFLKENTDVVSNLDNAYITSRYVPAIFDEQEVKNMENFTKKLDRFLKEL